MASRNREWQPLNHRAMVLHVERFNRTMHDLLLRSLPPEKCHWPEYLNNVATTTMAPHMHPHRWAPSVIFGQPLIAMERLQAVKTPGWLGINSDCRRHTRQFLGDWDRLLTNARKSLTGKPGMWKWERGCTCGTTQLAKNIQDALEYKIYLIIQHHGDQGVYLIEPADGFGFPKTVGSTGLKIREHPRPAVQTPPRRLHACQLGPEASAGASKSPSSSEFEALVMSGAQSVTTESDAEAEQFYTPGHTPSSSSSEVPLRRSNRARAGHHPNLHHEPHSCAHKTDVSCSICRVWTKESVFWWKSCVVDNVSVW